MKVLRTHGTPVFYGPLIGDVPTIAMNDVPRSTRLTYGVPGGCTAYDGCPDVSGVPTVSRRSRCRGTRRRAG
ncbi:MULTISPECIES: hypothetical protein [Streptomyces]|uniref:Uncharacterized protein n=2 Tax=Streptomyces TaxID=1883 RepID=A0ABV9IN04_9ACTN